GAVMGYERVAIYGIPLVARRRVGWARVDPVMARELFIRHALVDGEWKSHHAFLDRNRTVALQARSLEDKLRRRDVVDDDAVLAFYERRLPPSVVSARHFDAWWKTARREDPTLLDLSLSDLAPAQADEVAGCPDSFDIDDVEVALRYLFAPGDLDDGVTAQLPLALLNRVPAAAFSWHVPARREELAVALIRALPKDLRRALVPAPDTARAALAQMTVDLRTPFAQALSHALTRVAGVTVPPSAFNDVSLPSHLRMHVTVIGGAGDALATGDDLDVLREQLAPHLRRTLAAAAPSLAREGLREWPGGRLPRSLEMEQDGAQIVGYPALADTDDTVAVRILATRAEQHEAMRLGTRRLLLLTVASPARAVLDTLPSRDKLALARDTDGRAADAVRDSISAAVDALVEEGGGPAWDAESFNRLRDYVAGRLAARAAELLRTVGEIHQLAHVVRDALVADPPDLLRASYDDMRAQLATLVSVDVATRVGGERLGHVPRYLQAMQQRLQRLPRDPARDIKLMQRVHDVEDAWQDALDELPTGSAVPAALADVPWMLEELRVSLFAQQLGTAHPVSEKRILQVVHARA
ncbi:MAG TPA: DUF3418 domain-containing protein, partial [Mycobacteriales bacterium]|nr:DUF3418 domain-containing protein [Mycobacteriales bacterium]